MPSIIDYDLYRYTESTSSKSLRRARFHIPGFRFIYLFRKCHEHKRNSFLGVFYRLLYRKYSVKYGIQIPINTTIGKGLFIGHYGNIVFNSKVEIGDNCNIAHGVTIGQVNTGARKGCPKIGNKVWIGTGSVIVGNITIGNEVLIAPLTYVNRDIPNNSLAIGNPMKIIPRENAIKGYVNKILQ